MQKQLTGQPNVDTYEIRHIIKNANFDFKQTLVHLRAKKEECKQLKAGNDRIRAMMVRDQKLAEMFKVKEFSKKQPFLPVLG